VACGLPDVQMTSVALETDGAGERVPCIRKRIGHAFCQAHGRRQRLVSPARLGLATANALRGAPAGAEPIKSVPAAVAGAPAYAMAGHR
jgi:hypothetical protein